MLLAFVRYAIEVLLAVLNSSRLLQTGELARIFREKAPRARVPGSCNRNAREAQRGYGESTRRCCDQVKQRDSLARLNEVET